MSIRAQAVAEVLWELKRNEKLGTYSTVAQRAGFTAGTNGRTMITCLKKIRREWPHLEWWRALEDSLVLDKGSEHANALEKNGFPMEATGSDDKIVKPAELEEHLVVWAELDSESETDVEEEAVAS